MRPMLGALLATFLFGSACAVAAPISVQDDAGHMVTLPAPAQRIVALSPHLVELLFAAGAGDHVVGAVSYSDYPVAARKLPRVGSYNNVDLEAVLALKPDLVVAWQSGNREANLGRLRALGIPLFVNDPHHLDDVAYSLRLLGRLAGTEAQAETAASAFEARKNALAKRYRGASPVRVFYEIWNHPLMTVNGEHLISDVIRLCGGRNVFAGLGPLAPTISTESVIAANPQAIVASGMGDSRPEWLDEWRRWPRIAAVKARNLFFIPPELLQRHTPRILDGAAALCADLRQVRERAKQP